MTEGYNEELRRVYLPYALLRQDDGRYVLVNRLYKPVGLPTREWVDYAPYAVKLRMTGAAAKALSWNASSAVDVIYLYNDGCIPTDSTGDWHAYQERLKRLAAYQVRF